MHSTTLVGKDNIFHSFFVVAENSLIRLDEAVVSEQWEGMVIS